MARGGRGRRFRQNPDPVVCQPSGARHATALRAVEFAQESGRTLAESEGLPGLVPPLAFLVLVGQADPALVDLYGHFLAPNRLPCRCRCR